MSKKSGNKLKTLVKRGISAALVGIMGLSMITASDMYYGYSRIQRMQLNWREFLHPVKEPVWNHENIPERDTTGNVKYYYAGNAFTALNQLDGGAQQTGQGTAGHLKVYSDSNGARLVETTYNGKRLLKEILVVVLTLIHIVRDQILILIKPGN